MSHTWTRKVTQGQIQKEINKKEQERIAIIKEEEAEAKKWEDKRPVTGIHLKRQKDAEKDAQKQKREEEYKKEMGV